MQLPLSTTCLLAGLFGLIIGMLIMLRTMSNKAKVSNLIFSNKAALLEDWYVPAINLMLILLLWLVLPYRGEKMAGYSDLTTIGFFFVVGIVGHILLSMGLSSVLKRFQAATDFKTSKSDAADGTADVPTPAVKPPKTP